MFVIGLSCGFSLAVVVWVMSVAYNANRETDGYFQEIMSIIHNAQPIKGQPRVLGRGMNESLLLLQEAERIVNNR